MRGIILVPLLMVGIFFVMGFTGDVSVKSDYVRGWEDGWCEGWKDVKGRDAYCPYAPYAPYPEYNCSEGYRCGYNRGFKYGMCRARGVDCGK
jgi:hypothetical protein